MPLLVGLVDSANARASFDVPGGFSLRQSEEAEDESIDLEELAAKRHAGGGLLDSIANMANSILGAGESHFFFFVKLRGTDCMKRDNR